MLEAVQRKAIELNVVLKRSKRDCGDDSDTDDDDFIEVTAGGKDDYEAEVVNVDTLLGIPFYPVASASTSPKPGPSGLKRAASSKSTASSVQPPPPRQNTSGSWRLATADEEPADPTTFAATLAKLKVTMNCKCPAGGILTVALFQKTNSEPAGATPSPIKLHSGGCTTSAIPKLRFDVDLMNWGEKPVARQVIVDTERLRFWGGGGRDETMVVPGSDSTERSIEFTGLQDLLIKEKSCSQ
jgi:hypothetical protein